MPGLSADDDLKLLYVLHKANGNKARAQDLAAAMNLKTSAYNYRYYALMKRLEEQFPDVGDGDNTNNTTAAAAAATAPAKRKRAGKRTDKAIEEALSAPATKKVKTEDADAGGPKSKAEAKEDFGGGEPYIKNEQDDDGVDAAAAGAANGHAGGECVGSATDTAEGDVIV